MAQVCRRSWKRMLGSPAFSKSGLKLRRSLLEYKARVADPEAHPVDALLDLPGVDARGAKLHEHLARAGTRVVRLAARQHLARGTAAFVPGSSHPEASSFSPLPRTGIRIKTRPTIYSVSCQDTDVDVGRAAGVQAPGRISKVRLS